jgi:aldose 1-epimerase
MRQLFGSVGGRDVFLYTLRNSRGFEARITNYGGILVSLSVPDRWGRHDDVVLGYDGLHGYLADRAYMGALIGRFGNRIACGKFVLDGIGHTLALNDGANHLHGGVRGFDKVVWTVDEHASDEGRSLVLDYVSEDGEEGYPGTLSVRVVYSVSPENDLAIDYTAATDAPTVVNLTHHSYFNLCGAGKGDILGHDLIINADSFTPIDDRLIPTGEIRAVHGTVTDFREPARIGERLAMADEQLRFAGGFDHNWVLNGRGDDLRLAALLHERTSGRVMGVFTTEPGVQFYSGNFLDGTAVGKGNVAYAHRSGLCLETQHFPDSPNKPHFPPTRLEPGWLLESTTMYRFSVR